MFLWSLTQLSLLISCQLCFTIHRTTQKKRLPLTLISDVNGLLSFDQERLQDCCPRYLGKAFKGIQLETKEKVQNEPFPFFFLRSPALLILMTSSCYVRRTIVFRLCSSIFNLFGEKDVTFFFSNRSIPNWFGFDHCGKKLKGCST